MFGLFKKKNLEEDTSKSEPALDNSGQEITSEEDNAIPNTENAPRVWRKNGVSHDFNQDNVETSKQEPIVTNNSNNVGLESLVGKLVINLSNQIENITVGVGVEIINEGTPILSIYDIVRKEKIDAKGMIFAYNEQKFDALNQIEANARIALFFNAFNLETVDLKQQPSRPLVSAYEWKRKVLDAIDRINRGEWT